MDEIMINIEELAMAYNAKVTSLLTQEQREELDQVLKNGDGNEHDFLDANEYIIQVYEELTGEEFDFENEDLMDDCQEAMFLSAEMGYAK